MRMRRIQDSFRTHRTNEEGNRERTSESNDEETPVDLVAWHRPVELHSVAYICHL